MTRGAPDAAKYERYWAAPARRRLHSPPTAAERYTPDQFDRHRQFWGTVFYQAAQQRFFAGDEKGAAGWYRRADGLVDTEGPLADLALVDCLERQGRFTEAWEVYRRALAAVT